MSSTGPAAPPKRERWPTRCWRAIPTTRRRARSATGSRPRAVPGGHTSYSVDTFNDGTQAWQEGALSLVRRTPVGSLILRGTQSSAIRPRRPADRAGSSILLPARHLRRFSTSATRRIRRCIRSYGTAFDLYQSVGRGWKCRAARDIWISAIRRRSTSEPFRAHRKPDADRQGASRASRERPRLGIPTTEDLRRYSAATAARATSVSSTVTGSAGKNRNIADLTTLHSDTVREEMDWLVRSRFRYFSSTGGTSRQERTIRSTQWQTSITSGFLGAVLTCLPQRARRLACSSLPSTRGC